MCAGELFIDLNNQTNEIQLIGLIVAKQLDFSPLSLPTQPKGNNDVPDQHASSTLQDHRLRQPWRQRRIPSKSPPAPKGKWSVLIFMPAAFTFNCPTEIEDAAEHYAEFQKAGAEVYIVTTDTHFSHKVWHETSDAVRKAHFRWWATHAPADQRLWRILPKKVWHCAAPLWSTPTA